MAPSSHFRVTGLDGAATLTLADVSGKIWLVKEVNANSSVSVSSLPQGLYIVTLKTQNGTIQQKLIKE